MWSIYSFYEQPMWVIVGLLILAFWEVIWKGFALWHSAKNQQKGWFIVILLVNLLGLLPIIYLIWFKPRQEQPQELVTVKSARAKRRKRA